MVEGQILWESFSGGRTGSRSCPRRKSRGILAGAWLSSAGCVPHVHWAIARTLTRTAEASPQYKTPPFLGDQYRGIWSCSAVFIGNAIGGCFYNTMAILLRHISITGKDISLCPEEMTVYSKSHPECILFRRPRRTRAHRHVVTRTRTCARASSRDFARMPRGGSEYIYKKTPTQTYNPYHNSVLCFTSHTKSKSLNMSVYVITGVSKGIGVSLPYAVLLIACA